MIRQEFRDLLEKEGKDVYSFCCHLTGNREASDELYQETMLKAMERLSKIDSSKNPKSFLIGIAVGVWKNKKKKYARRQRIAPEERMEEAAVSSFEGVINSPEEEYLSKELIRLVKMETAALEEKYRLPVYMFYTAELPIEEIAKAMHIPQGTVKSRLHKARTIIGKKLEAYGYEK